MCDLFSEYKNQLNGILTSINNQVQLCKKGIKSTTHCGHLKELEGYISSAEEMLRQMELEARSSIGTLASERMDEVHRIRSILKEAHENSKMMSNELMRRDLLKDVSYFGSSNNLHTLNENDKLLEKGLMYLKTSCVTMNETEMMSNAASKELYKQGNIITNVKSHLSGTKLSLKAADDYLSKLLKQGRLNQVVLYTVFGAIFSSFIAIILIRFVKLIIYE